MIAKLRPARTLDPARFRNAARFLAGPVAAALLLAACTTNSAPEEPTPQSEAAPPAVPAGAWTEDFSNQAVIVAEEIRVTGPRGLLEHVAVQQDPTNHSHEVKTTSDGLRLESVAVPNALLPIRGQLDALSLAATRSLVVLESITAVDVVVEAGGDVYYHDVEAGKESRSPRLRLVGRSRR